MPISRQARPVEPFAAADPRYSRTLLLASDLQQSVLVERDRGGPNPFAYSPYGLQSGMSRASAHVGFNGQLKERSTGWYHLGNGHRIYSPVLMRFHSSDRLSPFGKGGINHYAYCGGSPVNRVDPTGQVWFAVPVLGQVVGTAVGALFMSAATIRTASAVVNRAVLSTSSRLANIFSFYGGVSALAVRPLGVPAALSAVLPNVMQATSVAGNVVSQISTFVGGTISNVNLARTTLATARATGQSVRQVAVETLKEVSGYNLLRGRDIGQVPHASHASTIQDGVAVIAREIRGPNLSSAQNSTRL
ncbi:RHS repeat-associated core domain-containing protein [Pseudomonas violetae]|jgi:RHS repeat-associated protein|uniref:RHS repeat-associated core domain-containing protein n=1 Tax=Pseudomonas violetae TaxID=2915813 RepID=A0ABT0EZH6_9PSED|nr:RHS repeat-associated core domain-containing protein [Pseudomonas violetae]MCK1790856.1 RHS repeat-associated core domain-containing protein [Pseudomonas violetae]